MDINIDYNYDQWDIDPGLRSSGNINDATAYVDIDFDKMYAADIAEQFVKKALRGQTIVGYDFTPSCELIDKIHPEEYTAKKTEYAHIKVEINMKKDNKYPHAELLPDDVDLIPWKGANYYGDISSEQVQTVFDARTIKPAMKQVISAMSSLYAYHTAAGGDSSTALKTLNIISGTNIPDLEDLTRLVTPNFHVRALINTGKPHSTIFGQGTLQRTLRVIDRGIVKEHFPTDAAVNWSRIMTITRYIAAINLVTMKELREAAKKNIVEISMMVIKGAYPTICEGDYILPRLTKYEGKTVNYHEELRRHWDISDYIVTEETRIQSALMKLEEIGFPVDANLNRLLENLATLRQRNKPSTRGSRVIQSHDINETIITRQSSQIAARDAFETADKGSLAKIAKEVVILKALEDDKFRKGCDAVIKARDDIGEVPDVETLANLEHARYSLVYLHSSEFAKRVITIATDRLGSENLAEIRYFRYYMNLTKSAVSNYAQLPKNMNVILKITDNMVGLLKSISWPKGVPPKLEDFKVYASRDLDKAIVNSTTHFINQTCKAWAARYGAKAKSLAEKYSERKNDKLLEIVVLYQALSVAYNNVSFITLSKKSKGYFDPNVRVNNYLHKSGTAYCRKRKIDYPIPEEQKFDSMMELAKALDMQLQPKVTFVWVEEQVRKRMEMTAGDLNQIKCGNCKVDSLEYKDEDIDPLVTDMQNKDEPDDDFSDDDDDDLCNLILKANEDFREEHKKELEDYLPIQIFESFPSEEALQATLKRLNLRDASELLTADKHGKAFFWESWDVSERMNIMEEIGFHVLEADEHEMEPWHGNILN